MKMDKQTTKQATQTFPQLSFINWHE